MNILDRLWEVRRDRTFAASSLQLILDLQPQEHTDALRLLDDMSESREMRHGYRVKRVASTLYKLIQANERKDDKGKPLIGESEAVTSRRQTSAVRGRQSETQNLSADGEFPDLERFSFFQRGDNSSFTELSGTIFDMHRQLTTNIAWKREIDSVRALTGEAQAKAKAALPAITPSVFLKTGKRAIKKPSDFVHTNLIQADFDESPDFDKLFDSLCIDPHARLVFRSPRGKVKALIKVSPVATVADHAAAFEAVRSYYIDKGFGEIDGKPRNINCLCFISHDPHAVLKDATPLHWEPLFTKPVQRPTPPPQAAPRDNHQKPTDDQIRAMLTHIPADDYEIWMTIGCALRREGYDLTVWDEWSQKSHNYNQTPDQMQRKWESFIEDHHIQATLGTIYHHAKQHGWQPPSRETYQQRKSYHQRKREETLCQLRQLQKESLI